MALSPGKAWDMINELEDKLGYTVVKRRRGGRNGGKTFLTEAGRQFLITCQRFEEQVSRKPYAGKERRGIGKTDVIDKQTNPPNLFRR